MTRRPAWPVALALVLVGIPAHAIADPPELRLRGLEGPETARTDARAIAASASAALAGCVAGAPRGEIVAAFDRTLTPPRVLIARADGDRACIERALEDALRAAPAGIAPPVTAWWSIRSAPPAERLVARHVVRTTDDPSFDETTFDREVVIEVRDTSPGKALRLWLDALAPQLAGCALEYVRGPWAERRNHQTVAAALEVTIAPGGPRVARSTVLGAHAERCVVEAVARVPATRLGAATFTLDVDVRTAGQEGLHVWR